jgi:uncharacterized Tic20 family protein
MTSQPETPPPPSDVPPPMPSDVPPPASRGAVSPDDRTWGTMAHVASIIGMFVGGLAILGPLVIWLLKKNESAYVAHHGREALNFQITVLIAGVVLFALGFLTCGLSWFLLAALGVVNIVFSIIGAVKANEGERWTYPFALRLVN